MRAKNLVLLLALLILLPSLFFFSVSDLEGRTSQESYKVAVEGIRRAAVQCYALEGYYPPSLSYLVEHYGLVLDTERYFVDYQYIGSNLMPDITVLDIDKMG